MHSTLRNFGLLAFLFLLILAFAPSGQPASQGPFTYKETANPGPRDPLKMSGAAHAMDLWWQSRAYPDDQLDMAALSRGYEQHRQNMTQTHKTTANQWDALGPHNVGGRTLRLLFNPQNPNTLYLGSAGGGLWRSYSAGEGADAWHRIPTGFPVLGVAAIAINPIDTNEIYIGTGEVYNYQKVGNRSAIRTTRGSYGIGILKSTDGGVSWSKSLDWAYDDLKGVQDMIINPSNPSTVLAATSEGIYRSLNSGSTWDLVETTLMGIDLQYQPGDTNFIMASLGNFASANGGIYRSTDGGSSFSKLSGGLPASFTGKITLSVTANTPYIWYASIADSLNGIGLYKSNDLGGNWSNINTTDYPRYQGWYSHDVGVSPYDPNWVMCVGVDAYKSFIGGADLLQSSFWYNWFIGYAPAIGGREGSDDYVHADIHEVIFHPTEPLTVYFATDGGVFRSKDTAFTFVPLNGSLQTTQFYANFSNSTQDSTLAMGGLQDNASVIYQGNKAWYKVIGGDGCNTEIDPFDDQNIYGSAQSMYLVKSTNRGLGFFNLNFPGNGGQGVSAFVSPFTMCRANPEIVYAGETAVWSTFDGGSNWSIAAPSINGQPVLKILLDPNDCSRLWASMIPGGTTRAELYLSTTSGTSWINVTGNLPDRYYHDININPNDPDEVIVALGGFGTDHCYRTTDAGQTWTSIGAGLPDVPANNVLMDPLAPNNIYLANDLGVYVSVNGGLNWQPYANNLPEAVMAMDLSYSPSNRKIRLATHGNGAWEADMFDPSTAIAQNEEPGFALQIAPNPAIDHAEIVVELPKAAKVSVSAHTIDGKEMMASMSGRYEKGSQRIELPVANWAAGVYLIKVTADNKSEVKRLIIAD
jgi:photosystem II stability/assembly factor-like uncharacterized protein